MVICGGAGEGKTVCAYQLVKALIDRGLIRLERCALICEPGDIRDVKADDVDLILIDNMFGKHTADKTKLTNWRNYFETLKSFTFGRKVRTIIASRIHILQEFQHEINSCQVFANKVKLDSQEMTKPEKREILECQLKRFGKQMEEKEIERCLSQHTSVVGFPLCCQLFASDEKLPDLKAEYFKSSFVTFLDSNLQVLEINSLIALISVFCAQNRLKCTDLNITTLSETAKATLCHITKLYGISIPTETVIKELRVNIESLKGSYLKEINGCISFLHDTMYEAIARFMLKDCPTELIDTCTVDFLCQCIRLDNAGEHDTEIVIATENFESLAKRCIREVVKECNAEEVSKHPAFGNGSFVEILLDQLTKCKEYLSDFFSVGVTLKTTGIHGFLYHVLSREETNEVFFDKAYPHLTCRHSCSYDDTCWKCLAKEEALAAVCGSNKQDIYGELFDDGANLTTFCLFKAVENPIVDPAFVSRIMYDLKKCKTYILEDWYTQISLGLSKRRKDDSVYQTLKSNGIRATVHFLYYAVQKGDLALLSSTIVKLKEGKAWKSDNYHVSRAILQARVHKNYHMLNVLSSFGAKIHEGAVYWAVVDHSFDEVVDVVKMLKQANAFDCESPHIAWALALAMKNKNVDVCDFLRGEGVTATTALVAALAELGESAEKIHDVIKELQRKDNWDVENHFIASAYITAIKRADKKLQGLLEAEGIGTCPACFYYAVTWFIDDVDNILKLLKTMDRFDPNDPILARTLVWATEYRNSEHVKWLLQAGLCFNMACLEPAVKRNFSLSTLETVINNIKTGNKWNTSSDNARVALIRAFNRQDKAAYELLISEGIDWSPRSLFLATTHESCFVFKRVLHKLEEKNLLDPTCPEIKNAKALAKSFKDWQKYREIRKIFQGK